jgi:hypothetical protein
MVFVTHSVEEAVLLADDLPVASADTRWIESEIVLTCRSRAMFRRRNSALLSAMSHAGCPITWRRVRKPEERPHDLDLPWDGPSGARAAT